MNQVYFFTYHGLSFMKAGPYHRLVRKVIGWVVKIGFSSFVKNTARFVEEKSFLVKGVLVAMQHYCFLLSKQC